MHYLPLCNNKHMLPLCVVICRTVFIVSEALDEQLKTLWFSPFQTDDIEADLDMVSVLCVHALSQHCYKIDIFPLHCSIWSECQQLESCTVLLF